MGVGVDCIRLIIAVGWAVGVLDASAEQLAPHLVYGRVPKSAIMRASLEAFLLPVEGEHRLADIGFFSWGADHLPMHMAIMAEDGKGRETMIHANGQVVPRRVRENGYDAVWQGRNHGFFRYPGLA